MEETSEGHMDQPFSQRGLDQLLRAPPCQILNTSRDRDLSFSMPCSSVWLLHGEDKELGTEFNHVCRMTFMQSLAK